ncbi:MAG: hypothetical protein WCR20_03060 [Verrucomicrobiota bacterium]
MVPFTGEAVPVFAAFINTARLLPLPLVQAMLVETSVVLLKVTLVACVVGIATKVNPVFVPVPPGVVTLTLPEVPAATMAVICVAELTVKEVAAVLPKLTAVAPVKFVPVMTTLAPLQVAVGVNEVIAGKAYHPNPAREAVPPGVVTLTLPEAPPATMAVIWVSEFTVIEEAAIPPKLTAVAPVRFVPVMTTEVEFPPLTGVNEPMEGAATQVNPALVAVPPGVVTLTIPEVPAATVAVICVAELTVMDDAGVPPKLTAVAPVR